MPQTRRNALATIAATSTLGLAGCTTQVPGLQSNDNPEDNPDETGDGEEEQEQINELGVQTGGFNADTFEEIEFNVEITGVGNNTSVQYGIQTKYFYGDGEWIPSGDRLLRQFDGATEPGQYTVSYERTVWGGGEYQYRAVATTGGEETAYGQPESFTLQDLGIDAPEIEFGEPSLKTSDPAVVEIPVENVSGVTSGVIRGDVQWFDSNDTFLGDSYGRMNFLRSGEEGVLRVSSYADGITQEDIADFEYTTRYNTVFEPMEGMEVVSSSMNLDYSTGSITGTATNELSDPPSYVDAVARFFDSDGVVIADNLDRQTTGDVPSGSNWQFEIPVLFDFFEVARRADDYEVVLLQ